MKTNSHFSPPLVIFIYVSLCMVLFAQETKLDFKPISMSLGTCAIEGSWENAVLQGTITDTQKNCTLSVTFPRMGRDAVYHFSVKKGVPLPFAIALPYTSGGNPYNRYQIEFKVKTENTSTSSLYYLTGTKYKSGLLGERKNSLEISNSRYGTCVHFSPANFTSNFSGWKDYIPLLDKIQAAGFKWIRGGIKNVSKQEDGTYKVDDWDIQWIKDAKKRGISLIGLIPMNAEETTEDATQRVLAIVRQTKQFGVVYELGNEPENFGNWRDKKRESFNAKKTDGSTAQWLKEYLKMSNVLAAAIKKEFPQSTVIGICTNPPAAFRALDIGVDTTLDGIAYHPYGIYLPAGKEPFGINTAQRDGVQVGDDEHSFEGVVESYFKKFKEVGKPFTLWVTEFGYTTAWYHQKNSKSIFASYSEKAQAVYLVRHLMESSVLPIEINCQYDFLDDYGSEEFANQANYGLLRADLSPKPAYNALARFNSLYSTFNKDTSTTVDVSDDYLNRAAMRLYLKKTARGGEIKADNRVHAWTLSSKENDEVKLLAVSSFLPVSGEFNNRIATLTVTGWKGYGTTPVAVDMITGKTFDVPCRKKGNKYIIKDLLLTDNPLTIVFFKNK